MIPAWSISLRQPKHGWVVEVSEAPSLLAEAGGGEDGVLLGVDADADVVRTAAERGVGVALRAAVAAALAAVGHAERGAVVAGADHPTLAGDHRADAAAEAVGAGARRQGDQQEVEVLVGAGAAPDRLGRGVGRHGRTLSRLGRRPAGATTGRLSARGRVAQPVRARGS